MHQIKVMPYGYRLIFSGTLTKEDAEKWLAESKKTISFNARKVGVIVDMRDFNVLSPEAAQILVSGQQTYSGLGMQRSAVILDNSTVSMQFSRISKESGIADNEIQIKCTEVQNFEAVAEAWVTKGERPPKGTPGIKP